MKNLIFLFFVIFWFNLSAQTKIVSFDEALLLAKEHNVALRKVQNSIEVAHWDVQANKNLFLPNATFTSNYIFQAGNNLLTSTSPILVGSTSSALNLQANSSYVVADGSARKYQLAASQKTEESLNTQLKYTRQQLINDISLAFLQLSLDRKLIEIANQNWQFSLKRDSLLIDLVKAGLRLPNDLYQQEAQARSDEQQVIATKNQLQKDRISLIRRLNLPENSYDFAELPEMPLENFSSDLLNAAYTKRNDLLNFRQQKEVIALKTNQIQSALKPQLVASGGIFTNDKYLYHQVQNGSDVLVNYAQRNIFLQLSNQINFYAGLGLVWNIFDRNQTKIAVAKNKIAEANIDLDIQDRQDQIRAEFSQALNDFETSKQQYITAKAQVEAAQAAFELQQGRFQNGLANLIDLFAAQSALINAQVNVARSKIAISYQQQIIHSILGDVKDEF